MLDSQTLKRFLVARKWDVAAAYRMYVEYAEHRTRVPRGSVRAAEVAVGLSHRKCFLQRPDTDDGDETVYIVMRRHMAGECSTQEAIDYVQFGFDRVSWARRSGGGSRAGAGTDTRGPTRQLEHHLDLLGKEQVVFLVDFTGFGWKNMDAKSAIQLLKQAQDHAPERLKKLVAYDPPVLFWTLWRVSARGEMRRPPGAARRD